MERENVPLSGNRRKERNSRGKRRSLEFWEGVKKVGRGNEKGCKVTRIGKVKIEGKKRRGTREVIKGTEERIEGRGEKRS